MAIIMYTVDIDERFIMNLEFKFSMKSKSTKCFVSDLSKTEKSNSFENTNVHSSSLT